jgi:hypothetical protein
MNIPDPNERHPHPQDGSAEHDPHAVVDRDETWVPPIDPVVTPDARGDPRLLGGFSESSMDHDPALPRPVTGGSPDGALEEAIRRELRKDASTTDLEIDVEVRDGTAYLRGAVSDLTDSDNVLEVAGRVPGVVDVVDELTLSADETRR